MKSKTILMATIVAFSASAAVAQSMSPPRSGSVPEQAASVSAEVVGDKVVGTVETSSGQVRTASIPLPKPLQE